MPYIGYNVTNAGSFAMIDDISSTFNGSNTSFTLNVGGVNITPNTANLLIAIDGVVQQAPDAYTVSGSTINFTGAPASGADFYGVLMGQSSYVENNSIGADELNVSGDGTSGQVLKSDGDGTFSWLSQSSITAPAGSLTGNTLASGVTASSLTSVGSLTGLTIDASDPILKLKSDGDGNANTGYVSWESDDGTSEGWIGYGSTGDSAFKLYLPSGNDHIEFLPNATSALTLTSTSATFAGKIYANGGLEINHTGSVLRLENDTAGADNYYRMRAKDNSNNNLHTDIGIRSSGSEQGTFFIKIPYNGGDKFTLNNSGNATFAGTVNVSGEKIRISNSSTNAKLEIDSGGGHDCWIDLAKGSTNWTIQNTGALSFRYESNEKLKIDGSANVTFTGSTYYAGGSTSRVYFNNLRAIEADTNGNRLHLGEDFTDVRIRAGMIPDADATRGFGNASYSWLSGHINQLYTNDIRAKGSGGVSFQTDEGTKRMEVRDNGDVHITSSGWDGGLDTSDTNVTGSKILSNGRLHQQIDYNSYGAEIILLNNIHSAGAVCSFLQYRTRNGQEGSLHGNSSGLSISNNSDYRKKERITDLSGSLDAINSLRPRQYYYREGFGKPTRAFAGFIAHELQDTTLSHLTTGTKDQVVTQEDLDNGLHSGMEVGDPVYQTVSYADNELITHLVKAVQELSAEVEKLKGN